MNAEHPRALSRRQRSETPETIRRRRAAAAMARRRRLVVLDLLVGSAIATVLLALGLGLALSAFVALLGLLLCALSVLFERGRARRRGIPRD